MTKQGHSAASSSGQSLDEKAEKDSEGYFLKDPEAFAHNLAKVMEESGKAWAAYLKPIEEKGSYVSNVSDMTDVLRTLNQVGDYWLRDPRRMVEAQTQLMSGMMTLWTGSIKRMMGEDSEPVATVDPKDRRFQNEEWEKNQFFDFCKQIYLIASGWAEHLVDEAADLDDTTKQKASFYVKQFFNALAPSNFVMTNPEVLRETLDSNGENLVRGMRMLAEDIERGKGTLKIRQTDAAKFKVGENLATTPGKVIFQNDVCQLIQYEPTTPTVLKRPLLIVPPWINKYYILDLNPQKSFIKWAVEQGHTVFVVSWVNPTAGHAGKTFEDYFKQGIIEPLDVIENITGERHVNAIGYCVGGTLLSVMLAWAAVKGDDRIKSATLFTTQVDFTHAGDLKIFIDEDQVSQLEHSMSKEGYLDGLSMATAFNMLRSNDLVWPYMVNNYLRGKAPFPFDLLYWNSDSTRLPAINHSFYLRQCYLQNALAKGEMVVDNIRIDLSKVTIPIYNLATREDHIAPAKSVLYGSTFFGGPVTFVLGGSGHIAGVINPPEKNKYQFWSGPSVEEDLDHWLSQAEETPGSWWPHWHEWIKKQDGHLVPARKIGSERYPPLEDAPGSYVMES
jgi:polyhydroxyalkanoate synthase